MDVISRDKIISSENNPEELEELYQSDPGLFKETFLNIPDGKLNASLFAFWKARLLYTSKKIVTPAVPLLTVFLIALVNALLVRIPAGILGDKILYLRFVPLLTLMSIASYFLAKSFDRTLAAGAGIFAAVSLIYIYLLPAPESSDSAAMALIHLPLATMAVIAIAFMQDKWRNSLARIDFVKLAGEVFVLTVLILLGGAVLSGLTMALFELMEISLEEWYMNNIGLIGIVSAPLVATYVYDSVLNRKIFITELLAKIFAPLFCLFVIIYLGAMVFSGRSPFVERDYLIVFNGLLVVILAITIFSLVSRQEETRAGILDYINISMLAATILIDIMALSAIIFRIFEFGISPNRFAVTGMNIVVLIHLALIGFAYFNVLKTGSGFRGLKGKVVTYFPVYVGWFAFMTFLFPLLFGFR